MKYRKQEPKLARPLTGTKSIWHFIKHFLDDIKIDLFHSSILLSGNIATQLIAVLAYPVLTRLYSASQFGEFSLFLSITGILAIISTGRLEYALMLPDKDSEARNLIKIGIRWCLIFSLACLIVSLIIGQFGKLTQKIPGLYWIGLYVFLSGTVQFFTLYRNRLQQYKKLAKVSVLQNTASSGIKIAFGFTNLISYGLIWGNIIGQFIATWTITKGYVIQLFKEKPLSVKATLQKYSAFPRYRMVQAVINSLSSNLPIFFITYYFSLKEAGFYALIFGIAMRVIVLISSSLYQVLYQKFSELKRKHQPMIKLFIKIIILLLMISFIPGVVIIIFAKPLVSIFFGNGWLEVTGYMRIMFPWLVMVFVASPFAFIFDVFLLQKKALYFDLIQLFSRILSLYIGLWFNNVFLAILLFSLSGVACQLFLIIWYRIIITKDIPELPGLIN